MPKIVPPCRAVSDSAFLGPKVISLAPACFQSLPRFVWMPEGDEAGSAIAVFGSDQTLPNVSIWRSVEELQRFVYQGLHG
jgi:Domain of unknown function (DUF3291)